MAFERVQGSPAHSGLHRLTRGANVPRKRRPGIGRSKLLAPTTAEPSPIGVAGSTGRLNGFERVNSYEALLEAAIALH